MDFSPEKRKAAGDLKNIGSILRDLPEGFKGVARIRMLREQKTYESELVLQNGFIIGASISCSADGAQLLGEKAFIGLVDLIKESSGGFEAYELADYEFKPYVASNESMLLELVRGLGRTLEEIGHVDEDIRKEGLVDLESQWKDLESKWKQFEEREKPYLEMILKADQIARSCETGNDDAPLEDDAQNVPGPSPATQTDNVDNTLNSSPAESPEQSELPSGDQDSWKGYGSQEGLGLKSSSDEKNLDDMILREEPWEKVSGSAAASGPLNERGEEKKEESVSNAHESSEAAQLRQELQGVFHGADTKEQKEESASSEKTLSDDFNERVRDAILGRSHHRLSENAVSAPKRDMIPPGQQLVKEDANATSANQPNAHDEWLSRANATLQRLKKRTEETAASNPVNAENSAPEAVKPVESVSPENEPQQDTLKSDAGEMDVPSGMDSDSIIEKIKEASGEEWDEKTSSEISDLKKDVDVYWGWDKRKKRFVGIDGAEAPAPPERKYDELTEAVAPPKSKVPLAQCSVLREELKKQAADAREIVIKKEEVTQAMLAAQTQQQSPPQTDVPQLKKKIGFMDKLKYAKYPQIIKVMEKVDGKKSIDDLARETKLTPASVKYIVEKLASDGYLSAKGSV